MRDVSGKGWIGPIKDGGGGSDWLAKDTPGANAESSRESTHPDDQIVNFSWSSLLVIRQHLKPNNFDNKFWIDITSKLGIKIEREDF